MNEQTDTVLSCAHLQPDLLRVEGRVRVQVGQGGGGAAGQGSFLRLGATSHKRTHAALVQQLLGNVQVVSLELQLLLVTVRLACNIVLKEVRSCNASGADTRG